MFINIDDPDLRMRKTFQAYGMNLVHEEGTTALFKKVVKQGNVVVDLGANIGYFTLLAAKLVGENGKVFSFEPEPQNFNYLIRNIELNNYQNVFAYQKAIADKVGKTKLYICTYDSGHHTINQSEGIEAYRLGRAGETKEIEIDLVTLDSFLADKTDKVDIVKIDVEGAEALAIDGMREILKKNRDIKIFLEYFPLLINKMGSSPQQLIELLMIEFKFQLFTIGHDYSASHSHTDLIKIQTYGQLQGYIKEEADHINLYLSRDSNL
jgi:FkbM family methyltransferase